MFSLAKVIFFIAYFVSISKGSESDAFRISDEARMLFKSAAVSENGVSHFRVVMSMLVIKKGLN